MDCPCLSLDRLAGLPRLRQLLASLGLRAAQLQQPLRSANLLDHLSNRETNLQSHCRCVGGMAVGALSRYDLLGVALDWGDEPFSFSAEPAFHADGRDGG